MNNKTLLALAIVGGGLFLASRARAEEMKPLPNAPIIPGTGGATAPTPAAAPGGGMAPSKAAVDLLKKNIGFLSLPRKEPSGAVIIGYGHKVVAGDPAGWADLTLKTPLTPEQGEALFLNDLIKHVEVINRLVTVPLNQNQYDALALLVFNIGAENFATSTLLKRLNEKDYAGAAEQFLVWNKSRDANNNLVVNEGLSGRRTGERALFLTPVVEVPGAVPPTQAPTGDIPASVKKNLIVALPGQEIGEGQWNPTQFMDVTGHALLGYALSSGVAVSADKFLPIGYWHDYDATVKEPVIVLPPVG